MPLALGSIIKQAGKAIPDVIKDILSWYSSN